MKKMLKNLCVEETKYSKSIGKFVKNATVVCATYYSFKSVETSYICCKTAKPATRKDIVEYNNKKGAIWTPYRKIKESVKTLFKEGWLICDIADYHNENESEYYWEQPSEKVWEAFKTLQWAGFKTKEEFLLPYGIPSFAYAYEKKLWKEKEKQWR